MDWGPVDSAIRTDTKVLCPGLKEVLVLGVMLGVFLVLLLGRTKRGLGWGLAGSLLRGLVIEKGHR